MFDIKGFRLLTTHQTQPKALPKHVRESLPVAKKTVYYKDLPRELLDAVWSEFCAPLLPLDKAGKLGVVLFQFPPWFLPHKESLAHIEECIERMEGYQLAVEFRHPMWFADKGHDRTIVVAMFRWIATGFGCVGRALRKPVLARRLEDHRHPIINARHHFAGHGRDDREGSQRFAIRAASRVPQPRVAVAQAGNGHRVRRGGVPGRRQRADAAGVGVLVAAAFARAVERVSSTHPGFIARDGRPP